MILFFNNKTVSIDAKNEDTVFDSVVQLSLMEDLVEEPNLSVFDVGCSTGFLTAMLVQIICPNGGTVVGVDRNQDAVDVAVKGIIEVSRYLGKEKQTRLLENVVVLPLDGTKCWGPKAPYDLVRTGFAFQSADCEQFEALFSQLKIGGRMVTPIGKGTDQQLKVFEKLSKNDFTEISPRFLGPQKLSTPAGLVQSNILVKKSDEELKADIEREKKLQNTKIQLDDWKAKFMEEHGRTPSRQDLVNDSNALKLFQTFAKLNRP
mmetsp:Transcript_20382/g.24750  ORF Transcript_20382/g.24750 Transcript_20382/m.24750 type:complete len:262 (+) Transcript_20382:304-1089(+)